MAAKLPSRAGALIRVNRNLIAAGQNCAEYKWRVSRGTGFTQLWAPMGHRGP